MFHDRGLHAVRSEQFLGDMLVIHALIVEHECLAARHSRSRAISIRSSSPAQAQPHPPFSSPGFGNHHVRDLEFCAGSRSLCHDEYEREEGQFCNMEHQFSTRAISLLQYDICHSQYNGNGE